MNSLSLLKQSNVKYLLLIPSSVISIIVLFCSYVSIFGFEYEHRFREEYIGPETGSKVIGVLIIFVYLIFTYLVTWFYNQDINVIVLRLIRSLFNTAVIVTVGFLSSFPLMLSAYLSLLY